MKKNNIIRIMGFGGMALGVSGCDGAAPSQPMPPASSCPADVGYDVVCEPDGWECPPTAEQKKWDCEPEYWVCGDGKWQYYSSMICNPPEVLPEQPEAVDLANPETAAPPDSPAEGAAPPAGDAEAGEGAGQ